jgi:hypothetical protein
MRLLSQPPPNGDESLIFVYFDKTPPPVPRDARSSETSFSLPL